MTSPPTANLPHSATAAASPDAYAANAHGADASNANVDGANVDGANPGDAHAYDANDADAVLFDAMLYPHRSLGKKGFLRLLATIGGISTAIGGYFMVIGAWPVFFFFGLDFLLVWLAFAVNYRDARLYESVRLSAAALHVRRVHPGGAWEEWRFQPGFLRLRLHEPSEDAAEVTVTQSAVSVTLGAFLSAEERRSFHQALDAALHRARAPVMA